jgi:hypothetical protein
MAAFHRWVVGSNQTLRSRRESKCSYDLAERGAPTFTIALSPSVDGGSENVVVVVVAFDWPNGGRAGNARFSEAEPLLVEGLRELSEAKDTPRKPEDRLREALECVVKLLRGIFPLADDETTYLGKGVCSGRVQIRIRRLI